MTQYFKASWDRNLKVSTVLLTIVVLGAAVFALATDHGAATYLGGVVPVGIIVGSALLAIRGYEVTSKHIAVRRLLWSTYLNRHELQVAKVVDIEKRGRRVAGNSGFFAYSGIYSHNGIGRYRAFLTRGGQVVLLEYPNRKVMLSPDDPERFAEALQP